MLEDFLSYISVNLSVNRNDKILLAISGGMDSMVMLELFRQSDFDIIVAHINHSTREGASDKDMNFVESYCLERGIEFFSKTLNYTTLSDGNFQENARHARYDFLKEVKQRCQCKWIATAHHQEDRWETFMMHLNRKAGLKGLTSLRPRENNIIRPLLGFSKAQITDYVSKNNVPYVHDISNDSDDYLRNSIRHAVTPTVLNLMPNFIENANASLHYLEESHQLLQLLIEQSGYIQTHPKSGHHIVGLEEIKPLPLAESLLFHILEPFGFNLSTTRDMLESNSTGKRFDSFTHEALLDRSQLIVRKKYVHHPFTIHIEKLGRWSLPSSKELILDKPEEESQHSKLWLDRTKIKWPLRVRSIQPGDKIKPYGASGITKTIKKICTDLKINRFEKEEMLVVCQGEEIIQIINRISREDFTTTDIKNALTFRITE
ncbi:MAG: tRNA lysidine(34) synthetase TilS [Saprospiraceae bacterium]|nr:tRNA lysidine(34) synthetase TilS [Saprospiraceae bacterium]